MGYLCLVGGVQRRQLSRLCQGVFLEALLECFHLAQELLEAIVFYLHVIDWIQQRDGLLETLFDLLNSLVHRLAVLEWPQIVGKVYADRANAVQRAQHHRDNLKKKNFFF